MTDDPGADGATAAQPAAWDGRLPGFAVRTVERLASFVFDTRSSVFYGAVALLAVVKNGIWYSGNTAAWLAIARAFPGHPNLDPGEQYLTASPLGPALASVLGITRSEAAYGALHLVVLLVGLVALVVGLQRRAGHMAARVGVVALFATPLSNVLLIALGQQDTFTVLALALAVCFESRPLAALAGAILGVEHLEVGAFTIAALASLGFRHRFQRSNVPGRGRLAALCIGLVIGAALTATVDRHMGLSVLQRESVIGTYGARQVVGDFLDNLPAWAFSVFCAWWVTVAGIWSWLRQRGLHRILGAWCAIAALVTVVTLDETRVFALLTWALVLQVVVLMCLEMPAERVRRITAVTFGAAVVLPRTIVFEGATDTANWVPLVTRVLHHL